MQSFLLIWCNFFLFIQCSLFYWFNAIIYVFFQCNLFHKFNRSVFIYLVQEMRFSYLIQSFLLMWRNLPYVVAVAKFQSSRGVSYILTLMDNCQTIWSHVFVLSVRWRVYLSVFCFVQDLRVAAVAWFQNRWGVPHYLIS